MPKHSLSPAGLVRSEVSCYKSLPKIRSAKEGRSAMMNLSKQLTRRVIFGVVLASMLGVACLEAQQQPPQPPPAPSTIDGRKMPLRLMLTLGLKAVTKEDYAFIDMVVRKVDEGVLPRALVNSTFLWARERANRESPTMALRPIVYFRPAILTSAKKLGIKL